MMPKEDTISRRGLFMKLGILFNGVVATALAVPILRYVLSSVTRGRANAYLDWVSLGRVSEFPEGETRLATFRNPIVMPADGKTVDTACWVRRIEGEQFQVFAINCAHLGCPVRWFPQSGLFMCPCHGGAYYRDGSRASGPPERGLFEYPYKVKDGLITIQPRAARVGFELHGGDRSDSHGAGFSFWRLQISAGADMDRRHFSAADDFGDGLQRAGAALRPGCLLGAWPWCFHRQPRTGHGRGSGEADVGRPHHRGRHAHSLLCAARFRHTWTADCPGGLASSDGAEARNQRMADARACRETSDLHKGLRRACKERWRSVRSLRRVEGSFLRCVHLARRRGVCGLFRPVRAKWTSRPNDHPNRSAARLFLFVALRVALVASTVAGDAGASRRPCGDDICADSAAVFIRRGRTKLASPAHRRYHDP